jgi:hypothetical protein
MCGRGDAVSFCVISDYRRLVKDPTETVERKNLLLFPKSTPAEEV